MPATTIRLMMTLMTLMTLMTQARQSETYSRSGPGGMLSVRVVGGMLQLVEAVPASGFNADVTELDDEVRADFSAGSDEYRVEAEYEDDQLFWTVDS
jgi:hypothetical protein